MTGSPSTIGTSQPHCHQLSFRQIPASFLIRRSAPGYLCQDAAGAAADLVFGSGLEHRRPFPGRSGVVIGQRVSRRF